MELPVSLATSKYFFSSNNKVSFFFCTLNMLIGFKRDPKPNKTKHFTYHYGTTSTLLFYEAILLILKSYLNFKSKM